MTRMSREFSLVLLGAGLLTAGYFMLPEQDYEREADKQAEKRVGGRPRSGGGMFVFIGSYGRSGPSSVSGRGGMRSHAMASIGGKSGGFGSMGSRVGGGVSG